MAQAGMKSFLFACLLLISLDTQAMQHHLLIVSGIGGTDEYRQKFLDQAARLQQAALDAGIAQQNITLLMAEPGTATEPKADKSTLLRALDKIEASSEDHDRVFMVLIGHGNSRGDGAVFNLPGPDISAAELGQALARFGERQLVVVNTASASGPFISKLTAPNRVIITATASAQEYHAPLFGEFFVAAFASEGADRDKDERISLLEAFDFARREVRRSYESDKRLVIEHALLDDNGDGEGSLEPGEYELDGALANRIYLQQPRSAATGAPAELIAMLQHKQTLEISISDLKRQRDSLDRTLYYDQLEDLLIELARLTRQIKASED